VVHLDVIGEADQWRLSLSSDPSLPETEILTYITTGQIRGRVGGSGDRGSAGAGALAADIGLSHVTGSLEEVAKQKVGLDVLRVRYDPQLGATVVAGRYLGPRVFVGLQQPVQYRDLGDRDTQNSYQTAAEVEYEAFPWLSMNLQGEVSLFRAFLRARHGY
jgi:autotransporter translocation and assembly factor TamB